MYCRFLNNNCSYNHKDSHYLISGFISFTTRQYNLRHSLTLFYKGVSEGGLEPSQRTRALCRVHPVYQCQTFTLAHKPAHAHS